jgi:hypothetical protein
VDAVVVNFLFQYIAGTMKVVVDDFRCHCFLLSLLFDSVETPFNIADARLSLVQSLSSWRCYIALFFNNLDLLMQNLALLLRKKAWLDFLIQGFAKEGAVGC